MKVNFIRKVTKDQLIPQDEFVIEKTIEIEHESFNALWEIHRIHLIL